MNAVSKMIFIWYPRAIFTALTGLPSESPGALAVSFNMNEGDASWNELVFFIAGNAITATSR